MNDAEDTALENENLICETVKDLTQDELDHTALKNAAAKNFDLTDEQLSAVHSLIEHPQQDCKTHDYFARHAHADT